MALLGPKFLPGSMNFAWTPAEISGIGFRREFGARLGHPAV